jgi:hypothetical protein
MNWRDQLTEQERARLVEIDRLRDDLTAEYRRIYDRCRKRSKLSSAGVSFETKRGDVFIVDEQDAALIAPYPWFSVANKMPGGKPRSPYIQGKVNGRRVYLHRFLTNAPDGMSVDHIDGDPLNNCRSNLRVVDHAQNMRAAAVQKLDSAGLAVNQR